MLWRYILLLGVALIIYLCVGGVGFHFIEHPRETETRQIQTRALTEFLVNRSCISQDQLDVFILNLLKAYDAGVVVTANTSSQSNWDFASSLFFSLTVVTTIGYGHISPSTPGGQAFFVIYALLGIPLCGAFILNIGLKLQKPLQKLLDITCSSRYPKTARYIKICLFVAVSLLILLFVPAAVFSVIEEWTYGEALYYCVVTMTTVGFGDFVPGQSEKEHRAIYHILVMIWILIGYAWLAMMLSKATDHVIQMEDKFKDKRPRENKTNKKDTEDDKGHDQKDTIMSTTL